MRTNDASVINYYHRIAFLFIGAIDAEVDVLAYEHGVPEFDPVSQISAKVPGIVNLDITSDRSEGIGSAHPNAI
jgi:hypothetical protein